MVKDRFPKWWIFYSVARSLFLKFGIISFALLFFLCMLPIIFDDYVRSEAYLYAFLSGMFLLSPFAINFIIAKNRKQKLRTVVDNIKATGLFNPTTNSEGWLFWNSTYLGFDFHKGTFLYVRIYPGNVMDVIGFDAYSLVRTEVEGSKLRLYTRLTSLPMIPIDTGSASSIADHLHAMNNKRYSYNFDFHDVVNKKHKELEQLAGMPVPELI